MSGFFCGFTIMLRLYIDTQYKVSDIYRSFREAPLDAKAAEIICVPLAVLAGVGAGFSIAELSFRSGIMAAFYGAGAATTGTYAFTRTKKSRRE